MTTSSSKIFKAISVALLLIFSLHSFSLHGFANSLIYCFESNGDIKIESISPYSFGFESDCDLHKSNNSTSNEVEYHSDSDFCNDMEFSDIYFENNRTNRLDKETNLKLLSNKSSRFSSFYTAPLNSDNSEILIMPIFKPIAIKSIQSVILII